MHIPHHDLLRFEAVLGIIYAATSLRSLQERIMRASAALVGNQWVSYNETAALGTGSGGLSLNTHEAPLKLHRVLHALWHEHPTVHPRRKRGQTGALTFADCLARRDVERLPIYNEYYRPLGVRDQLVLFLDPGDKLLRCISISREQRSFSDRDRLLVNLLRPHFDRAARQISLLEHLTAQQAVLVLSPEGVIELISPHAGQCLREACGPIGREGSLAPAVVRQWLQTQLAAPLQLSMPLRLPARNSELVLRLSTRDALRCTILVERITTATQPLAWARLTPRERDVLLWIVRGKSNPEIAIILQMGRRTVEKHMENILAKLALETRAQVMRAALEQGLLPEDQR